MANEADNSTPARRIHASSCDLIRRGGTRTLQSVPSRPFAGISRWLVLAALLLSALFPAFYAFQARAEDAGEVVRIGHQKFNSILKDSGSPDWVLGAQGVTVQWFELQTGPHAVAGDSETTSHIDHDSTS